jgi:anti-anti-sigma factor
MEYETEDYKVREFEGVTVVRLKHANLTGALEVNRITEELKAMVRQGVRRLVIDLKHVDHFGSGALGMLIALNRKMTEAAGRMVLSHPEKIEELLRISKTMSLFEIAPEPKAAVAMFLHE